MAELVLINPSAFLSSFLFPVSRFFFKKKKVFANARPRIQQIPFSQKKLFSGKLYRLRLWILQIVLGVWCMPLITHCWLFAQWFVHESPLAEVSMASECCSQGRYFFQAEFANHLRLKKIIPLIPFTAVHSWKTCCLSLFVFWAFK